MLIQLHIKDLAIVNVLTLDMEAGMSALTGETGAGKSILIDALELALGDRTDNDMIRADATRAEIAASFDLSSSPAALSWLREQELDEGDECIVRRVLVRNGRSRSFINGRPVSMAQVQYLAEQLVDIHGQHAHQALLRRDYQRRLLDAYGELTPLADGLAAHFRKLAALRKRRAELSTSAQQRIERLDLLRYQSGELHALAFSADEWQALDEEQTRLSHAGHIRETCGALIDALYDADGSAHSVLISASARLSDLADLEPRLREPRELLDSALIQTQEAASTLRHYLDSMDLDPERLREIELRLGAVMDLARKYRVKPEEIPERLARIDEELAGLEQADQQLEGIDAELAAIEKIYFSAAEELAKARRAAARKLEASVTEFMQTLGMKGGTFSIRFEGLPPEEAGAYGLDRIEYLVNANPGHPPQPLAKVASGGELSRISLAIQVATAQCGDIPTLVFDEVDVGIGGGIAETVGQLLRRLGENRQVLCVTHLPQVASQAHHHLLVSKQSDGAHTYSGITRLDAEERVEEIARMLGGVKITRQTLAHAEEMIDQAQKTKPKAKARAKK